MEIKHIWQEGRRIKTAQGTALLEPFIMPTRNDACNFIRDSFETTAADDYIFEKQKYLFCQLVHIVFVAFFQLL